MSESIPVRLFGTRTHGTTNRAIVLVLKRKLVRYGFWPKPRLVSFRAAKAPTPIQQYELMVLVHPSPRAQEVHEALKRICEDFVDSGLATTAFMSLPGADVLVFVQVSVPEYE